MTRGELLNDVAPTPETRAALKAIGKRLDQMIAARRVEDAICGLKAAFTRSASRLEDFGIRINMRACQVDWALRHRPHLLRRKSSRLRKKAPRDLPRRMTPADKRDAFQSSALAAAEESNG